MLAVCGGLGCTRERLLALLWPEHDEAGSRHGLRDALHALRRTLGADAVPAGGHLLRLNPAIDTSDILAFTQALSSGRPADAVFDDRLEVQYGSGTIDQRARILARLGESDAAFALVERLLERPSLLSVHELRLSPDFDPIRSDPRYQVLLQKYASRTGQLPAPVRP